jgi:hypothetical protein
MPIRMRHRERISALTQQPAHVTSSTTEDRVLPSPAQLIFKEGETEMGDKGKRDKSKREQRKKAKLDPKEKRKLKKEKKNKQMADAVRWP